MPCTLRDYLVLLWKFYCCKISTSICYTRTLSHSAGGCDNAHDKNSREWERTFDVHVCVAVTFSSSVRGTAIGHGDSCLVYSCSMWFFWLWFLCRERQYFDIGERTNENYDSVSAYYYVPRHCLLVLVNGLCAPCRRFYAKIFSRI